MAARRVVYLSVGAAVILLLIAMIGSGSLLMLSSTTTDNNYSFNSPSNARIIRLIETCRDDACSHQAVISETRGSGARHDIRCGLDIAADRPVFEGVTVSWMSAETGVTIRYGAGGRGDSTYELNFARDCNA